MSIFNSYIIASPLGQFEVSNLISINAPILNHFNITLTNLGLYSMLVITIILLYQFLGNNDSRIIPSKWSISLEALHASILHLLREQLGKEIYLPFIYSLFMFILICNLMGNIPYSFTIFTSAVVSLGFSITIWIAVTILGLSIHKLHFFSYFIPAGTPIALVPLLVLIELISYIARALSLGLRIFANLIGGHTLLKILASFLYNLFGASIFIALLTIVPFALFLGILGLEIAISIIQTFVFIVLTASYIKDAINLH